MAELKTKPTDDSVQAFLDGIADPVRQADCRELAELMARLSGAAPRMWGAAMVGFGEYHYRYESGREGDWFRVGLSPRKNDLTLYLMSGFERWPELMSRLGKYKTGKSCLYLKRLTDVDRGVLEALITESLDHMARTYPPAA